MSHGETSRVKSSVLSVKPLGSLSNALKLSMA